jgi:hypothetical protein
MPGLATPPTIDALLAAARRAGVELVTDRREVPGRGLDVVVGRARDAAACAARGGVRWPSMVEHAVERWAALPALAAAWALRTGNEGALAFAKHLLKGVSAGTPGA